MKKLEGVRGEEGWGGGRRKGQGIIQGTLLFFHQGTILFFPLTYTSTDNNTNTDINTNTNTNTDINTDTNTNTNADTLTRRLGRGKKGIGDINEFRIGVRATG